MRGLKSIQGTILAALAAAAWGQTYSVSTIAGGVTPTPAPATSVSIGLPSHLAVDGSGNIYFAGKAVVLKVDRSGTLTRIAGTGRPGYSGDGGAAVDAQLYLPGGIALDGQGNTFVADIFCNCVRKIDSAGKISTVAGTGQAGMGGDGGPATKALLNVPRALAADRAGNLYIADMNNQRVRKVLASDGSIQTVAETPAVFGGPTDVALDSAGNLYVALPPQGVVLMVNPQGNVGVFAKTGLNTPVSVAWDSRTGAVYMGDAGNGAILSVAPGGSVKPFAGGTPNGPGFTDGKTVQGTRIAAAGLAFDPAGNLLVSTSSDTRYVSDSSLVDPRIWRISDGTATLVAGNGFAAWSGDGKPAAGAQFQAGVLAMDANNNLYLADRYTNVVRRISPAGMITTVAGVPHNGQIPYYGFTAPAPDYNAGPAPATGVKINADSVASDKAGTLYIADGWNSVVRKVDVRGVMTTFAGTGKFGHGGDGVPATSVDSGQAESVAVDGLGNVYFTDVNCSYVRKVTTDGLIHTMAGLLGSCGIPFYASLAADAAGNIWIDDFGVYANGATGDQILKTSTDGSTRSIAGAGTGTADGIAASSSALRYGSVGAMAADSAGNLYFADVIQGRVRRIDSKGILTTIAGTGTPGYSGDGGPALQAQFLGPSGLAIDSSGNIYVADANAIRMLTPLKPNLTIQKAWQSAAGGNPKRGDTFTYSITVTNAGDGPASGVIVQDTPDSRTELALQAPTTINLGALAAGASQTALLPALASAAGTYTNSATVTYSDSSGKSASAGSTTSTTVDPQPADFAATVAGPVAVAAGLRQVLADGNSVYAVNNPGDNLTILNCAGGACNITATVSLGAGARPIAVAKMDIDGDGQNDVLVLNEGTATVTALLTSNPASPVVSDLGGIPTAFAPFKASDGVPRIAVTFSGAVTIFAWDGARFQATAATQAVDGSLSAVLNGDFNGDGADDLLVANTTTGVEILFGDGLGGFHLASGWLDVGASPVALAAGDLNNDGRLDATVLTADGLVVLLNNGTGTLTPQTLLPRQGTAAVVLADFDGDGNLDAAVANTGGSSVSLLRGDGMGGLMDAGSYLTGKTPVSLTAADLDANGATDLIVGASGTRDLTVLLFAKP